jgi:inosine-uridine nucleoside N-ribohydrolase
MPPRVRRPSASLAGLVVAALAIVACSPAAGSATPAGSPTPTPDPVPVIVDTDLDISDLVALAILVRDPAVDVRAITVEGTGLVHCEPGLRVLAYVLDELDAATVPSACGREDGGPDARPFPDAWRASADAGYGLDLPAAGGAARAEAATALLARAVDESPSAPSIIALGPWTNLQDAFALDPTLPDRIARIHAMAGAVDAPGNVAVDDVTPEDGLEWNLAADPSAAAAVLDTDVPLILVPLDATDDVPVPADLADRLATDLDGAGADLAYELLVRFPGRLETGQQLWDELTALAFTDPELVTWQDAELAATEAGRLVRDAAGRPVQAAIAADRPAVETALLEALGRGPPRATPFATAGELTFRWDGAACTRLGEAGGPGVYVVEFQNGASGPAALAVIGIREPRTWADVIELATTVDPAAPAIPEWVIQAGVVADQTGSDAMIATTMTLEAGTTYGPVCQAGRAPAVELTLGEPFDIAP